MSIRVGVVGVGSLGQYHAKIYHELPNTDLIGVVDNSMSRATEIASLYHTQAYETLADLLQAGVEAISIVVPTSDHFRVTMQCFEANCHVLLEKPIAMNLEEADYMIQLAERKQRIFQIGHIERFNRVIQVLRELDTYPQFIESHRLGPFSPRNLDIGVVLDLMIHDIDIILELVDAKITHIDAVGLSVLSPTEDIANVRIQFENGCIANLTASRISSEKIRKIRIFQGNAYLSIDYLNQEIVIHRKILNEPLKPQGIQFGNIQIVREQIPVLKSNALQLEIKDFLDCVLNNRSPIVTGKHAKEALAVALQIVELIQKRK
jgi:predicted dehydrogenase